MLFFHVCFKQVLIHGQATGHCKKISLLALQQVVECQQLDGEVTFDQDPPGSREGIKIRKNADWVARKAMWLFRRMA